MLKIKNQRIYNNTSDFYYLIDVKNPYILLINICH